MNTHVGHPAVFTPVYAYWPYGWGGWGGWNAATYSYRDNNGNYRNFDYGNIGGFSPWGGGYAYGWNADWGNRNKNKRPYDYTQSNSGYATPRQKLDAQLNSYYAAQAQGAAAPKSFDIPWAPILGTIGGGWLGIKLLGSWGAGLGDSLLSLATVALTAAAGAIVFSKAADALNAYGAWNKQRSSSPYNGYTQNEPRLPAHSATRAPGDLNKAVAQYRSGAAPAATADIHSAPTNAPFTPAVAKNTPKPPHKSGTTLSA